MKLLPTQRDGAIISTLVMLRGLITTADHAASAHLEQVPQGIQRSWETFADTLKIALQQQQAQEEGEQKEIETYEHQRACAKHSQTSAMLIAPTGSGKTEAALYWAMGNGTERVPRIFYALPYQASMNAMHQRLSLSYYFGTEAVGLQHGHALQTLYRHLVEAQSGPASARKMTQWRINLNRLHAYPIKVFSPYQMLKVLYQIKGFEGMLADYTQAAFIFDEIHAYDANRLALILALIKHLREQYGVRFLVMSATFPRLLRDIMPGILGMQESTEPITAADDLFAQFCRHRLELLDGSLLEQGVVRIVADVRQGKSVLVCCNTVQRAQEMRATLLRSLRSDQVELLHSRFTMRDRLAHEKALLDRCASGVNGDTFAVVATQVVEVSLNIDLDTIYTDPAPLDALIQRFGRVNRARKKGIVPVHVFREPRDGQGIYQEYLVQQTLNELEQHDGDTIDEAAIGEWLDAIYSKQEICGPWKEQYTIQFELAEQLLRELRPFNTDEQREEEFEKLFNGVEVLPSSFEQQYLAHMQQDEFIEASQLFVPISHKKYLHLKAQGKIKALGDKAGKRWIVKQKYDTTLGLLFDTLSPLPNDEF